MKIMKAFVNIKLVVNKNEVKCKICGNNKFNAKVIRINCENGYTELRTECNCCGRIEAFNYKYAKETIQLIGPQ